MSPSRLAPDSAVVGRIRLEIRRLGVRSRLAPKRSVVGRFPQPPQPLEARSRLAPPASSVGPTDRYGRPPSLRAAGAEADHLGRSPGCASASRDSSGDARPGDKRPSRRSVAALRRGHRVETTCGKSDTGACGPWLPSKGKPAGSASMGESPIRLSIVSGTAIFRSCWRAHSKRGGSILASRGGSILASGEAEDGGPSPGKDWGHLGRKERLSALSALSVDCTKTENIIRRSLADGPRRGFKTQSAGLNSGRVPTLLAAWTSFGAI